MMTSESRKKTAERGETPEELRNADCKRESGGHDPRVASHGSTGSLRSEHSGSKTPQASHESRFDKVTACKKPHWPNKPIASQTQGRNCDTTRIASRGVGLVARRETIVPRVMRINPNAVGNSERKGLARQNPGHTLNLGDGSGRSGIAALVPRVALPFGMCASTWVRLPTVLSQGAGGDATSLRLCRLIPPPKPCGPPR